MPRALLAAFVVVLIALVVFGGFHPPVASAQAARPAAPVISIQAVNGYGDGTDYFQPGVQSGAIFFVAHDYSGDTGGTVTLRDQNATRDHIPSPAATWSITFHGDVNNSVGTSMYYELPYNLTYAGLWVLSLTVNGTTTNLTLYISTYAVVVTTSSSSYLAGHSAELYWNVYALANDAPFSTVSSIDLVAVYQTTTGSTAPISGLPHLLTVAATGSVSFTVPSDAAAYSSMSFLIWANQTGTGINWTEANGYDAGVAKVNGVDLSFLNCVGGCRTFAVGAPILVQAAVSEESPSGVPSLSGLNAAFKFFEGKTATTPPAGTPTDLVTNESGLVSFVLLANSSSFSTTQTNMINVSVTDPDNPSLDVNNSITFGIAPTPQSARVQVLFGQAVYAGGDNATATWSLGGATTSGAPGWAPTYWEAYAESDSGGSVLLGAGAINSTSDSGSYTVAIPVDFRGTVYADVDAANATEEVGSEAAATVVAPTLLLNPSESIYNPGDQITVALVTQGQVFSTATYYEVTQDDSGNVLSTGTVTGTAFTVKVPTVSPPSELIFHVAAQTTSDGIIATAESTVYLSAGLTVSASVTTASQYSDGSYKPGQSVSVAYSLTALGNSRLPTAVSLEIVPSAGIFGWLVSATANVPGVMVYNLVATSGSVTYTIPSASPNGLDTFVVIATPLNGCTGDIYECSSVTQFTVNVNSNPPALGYELGGTSGLTLGWVLLFLVVVILFVLAVVWARRHMGGGSRRTEPPKPFVSSPPSDASAASGAPPPGAGGPPGLPPAGGTPPSS